MNIKKQAFTIPELVVIITVLSVLMGISFLSFSGYSKGSRDTLRFSDLNNIKVALDSFYNKSGKYPETSSGTSITYRGLNAWTQGSFGKSTFGNIDGINKIPVDPVTGNEYMYSLVESKKEFELAAALEGDMVSQNNLLDSSYAGVGDIVGKSLVIGRYNGQTLKVVNGASVYVLAIPTIINGDISLITVEDIISNKKLAYNGSNVVAGNYIDTAFNVNQSFNYSPSDYLVYDGLLSDLVNDENKRILLLRELQMAYEGTTIENDPDYKELSNLEIDLNNPTTKVKQSSCFFVKNNIKNMADCTEDLTTALASIAVNLGTLPSVLTDLFLPDSGYTSNWDTNSCDTSLMTVVNVSPGTNTIPENMLTNTIYKLTTGNYILSYVNGSNMSDCSAIIGNGDSKLFISSVSSEGIINMAGKSNIILSGLKLDGYHDGLGGNHADYNTKGISYTDLDNSTFIDSKIFNFNYGLMGSNSQNNLYQNLVLYNTEAGFIGFGVNNSNIFNNIYGYNNNETSIIYTGGENTVFNNIHSHNNEDSIQALTGENIILNNIIFYNDHFFFGDNKIYGTGVILNNAYIYNSGIPLNIPSGGDIKYYGVFKEFDNDRLMINPDKLVAGIDGFLGFSNGVMDTVGTFSLNSVTTSDIGGWDYTLTGNNCVTGENYVGCMNATLTDMANGDEVYTYGSNIINQTKPLRWNGVSFELYGSDGIEYNSSKKVGEW